MGIDAHKKDLFTAMLVGKQSDVAAGQRADGRPSLGAEARARRTGPRGAFYEAGPCGYAVVHAIVKRNALSSSAST